jgi:hypothetical protein
MDPLEEEAANFFLDDRQGERPATAAYRYRVFAVPGEGDGGERLLRTFARAFEAAAFARLLSEGGRFARVRVEDAVKAGQAGGGREGPSAEPLRAEPGPGAFYKSLYVGSLLGGGLLCLGLALVGALAAVVALARVAGVRAAPGVLLAIFLPLAAGLLALLAKIHAAVFREPGRG